MRIHGLHSRVIGLAVLAVLPLLNGCYGIVVMLEDQRRAREAARAEEAQAKELAAFASRANADLQARIAADRALSQSATAKCAPKPPGGNEGLQANRPIALCQAAFALDGRPWKGTCEGIPPIELRMYVVGEGPENIEVRGEGLGGGEKLRLSGTMSRSTGIVELGSEPRAQSPIERGTNYPLGVGRFQIARNAAGDGLMGIHRSVRSWVLWCEFSAEDVSGPSALPRVDTRTVRQRWTYTGDIEYLSRWMEHVPLEAISSQEQGVEIADRLSADGWRYRQPGLLRAAVKYLRAASAIKPNASVEMKTGILLRDMYNQGVGTLEQRAESEVLIANAQRRIEIGERVCGAPSTIVAIRKHLRNDDIIGGEPVGLSEPNMPFRCRFTATAEREKLPPRDAVADQVFNERPSAVESAVRLLGFIRPEIRSYEELEVRPLDGGRYAIIDSATRKQVLVVEPARQK